VYHRRKFNLNLSLRFYANCDKSFISGKFTCRKKFHLSTLTASHEISVQYIGPDPLTTRPLLGQQTNSTNKFLPHNTTISVTPHFLDLLYSPTTSVACVYTRDLATWLAPSFSLLATWLLPSFSPASCCWRGRLRRAGGTTPTCSPTTASSTPLSRKSSLRRTFVRWPPSSRRIRPLRACSAKRRRCATGYSQRRALSAR
jgi:hypothetical protein